MTTANQQIVNLPFLYVNNLQLSWASNTTLTINAGQCRDSTNAFDLVLSANTTLNAATTGINALDTGSLAASTFYAVFVIGDSTNKNVVGTLLSTSSTAPTLPLGYDVFRRIGWAKTDGSSHFLLFYQTGNGGARSYYWDALISVLSGGVATSLTAVSLATAVPVISNCKVTFYCSFTPATASNAATFVPGSSSSSTAFDVTGVVAAKAQDSQIVLLSTLVSSVPNIKYKVSNSSDAVSLSVMAFDDAL